VNTLNPAIIARFIKIKPKTWTNAITLRVELYGCYDGIIGIIIIIIIIMMMMMMMMMMVLL